MLVYPCFSIPRSTWYFLVYVLLSSVESVNNLCKHEVSVQCSIVFRSTFLFYLSCWLPSICKWSTSGHQCDLLCHDLKRKFEKLHSLPSGVLDDCQNFALKPTSSGTRTVFALKDRWSYMRITAPASLAGWRQICSDNIMRFASIYFKNSLCYDFFKTILNKYFVSL